jgi:hypothetical protein
MNATTQKLIIAVCRVFEVISALVAMASIFMIFWTLGLGERLKLAIWIGILLISCFLWLFLSRIKKESMGEVLKFNYIAKTMTEVIRGIAGGIGLIGSFASVILIKEVPFPKAGFFAAIGILIISAFSFLFAAGKLRQPIYILIIPAMLIPPIVDLFLFRYEHGKGGVMVMLMMAIGLGTFSR